MRETVRENAADIVIIGGSTGGCAAALAACRNGKTVVMSEETQWIGGQLTSQTVPPDEHRFIEWFGSSESYRELRRRIRAYYLDNFPVSTKARAARWFNPGNHECSTLACEPRAALAALTEMLAPVRARRPARRAPRLPPGLRGDRWRHAFVPSTS